MRIRRGRSTDRAVAAFTAALFGLASVLGACTGQRSDAGASGAVTAAPTTTRPVSWCPEFGDGETVGSLAATDLTEASGIAASRRNPGVWWVHNDSQNPADVFAVDGGGGLVTRFHLTGTKNRDWEDIAVGPGPEPGVSYLYVGDIGDNAEKRSAITILRVPEPAIAPGTHDATANLDGAVALTARYPDGPRNAETLMVDPDSGELLIVTKAVDGMSKVAIWPAPQTPEASPHPLTYTTTLAFGEPPLTGGKEVTGGDISPDGHLVVLRTYSNVYCWLRPDGASVSAAFASPPTPMPVVIEPQGEAIGFAADGASYRTTSEGGRASVTEYRRR